MKRILFLFLIIISYACTGFASNTRVLLKKVSHSGKTILLNTGSYTGLKELDRAKLVFQKGLDRGDYFEVATIELIKVYPNYSYWNVVSVKKRKNIKAGTELTLLTFDDLLKGKRPYRFLKKKVIVNQYDDIAKYKRNLNKDSGDIPTYKKEGHDYYINQMSGENFDPDNAIRTTLGTYNVSGRGSFKLDEYERDFKLKESPDQDMIDDIDNDLLERDSAVATGYLSATSKRIQEVDEKDLETIENLYKREKYLKESQGSLAHFQANKKFKRIEFMEQNKINKRTDPMWSATMQEREIRNYLLKSGFKEERQRQKHAMTNRKGHELFIRYSFDTGDNIEQREAANLQGLSHSFTLGFGYHLSQTAESLDNWVASLSLLAADDYYNMGISNFKSTEKTMRFTLDYYFVGSPDKIGGYTWFLGAGIKLGKTELISGDVSGVFSYDIRSFQSLRFGFRYRFDGGDELDKLIKIGYGFSVLVNYESIVLSASDFGQLPGDMYARTTVSDYRVAMGFDFFF